MASPTMNGPVQPPRTWPLVVVAALLAVLAAGGGIVAFVLYQKKRIDDREEQVARDAAELTEGSGGLTLIVPNAGW